jgi:hypothetical protein
MTTHGLTAPEAVASDAADVRIWLYDAAEALDGWGGTPAAVALRTAAELLGSPYIVRQLRLETIVRLAHEAEAHGVA